MKGKLSADSGCVNSKGIDFIEIKYNLKKYKDSYQKYKDKKKTTEITEEYYNNLIYK